MIFLSVLIFHVINIKLILFHWLVLFVIIYLSNNSLGVKLTLPLIESVNFVTLINKLVFNICQVLCFRIKCLPSFSIVTKRLMIRGKIVVLSSSARIIWSVSVDFL